MDVKTIATSCGAALWGLEIAPASFGQFAGDLLIGNFGDGEIHAYDPMTGALEGALLGPDGMPISIDGLWALTVGDGGAGGDPNILYFTAGPFGEDHGLFGSLTAVPETSTWALMLAGFGGLGLAALRRRKSEQSIAT